MTEEQMDMIQIALSPQEIAGLTQLIRVNQRYIELSLDSKDFSSEEMQKLNDQWFFLENISNELKEGQKHVHRTNRH